MNYYPVKVISFVFLALFMTLSGAGVYAGKKKHQQKAKDLQDEQSGDEYRKFFTRLEFSGNYKSEQFNYVADLTIVRDPAIKRKQNVTYMHLGIYDSVFLAKVVEYTFENGTYSEFNYLENTRRSWKMGEADILYLGNFPLPAYILSDLISGAYRRIPGFSNNSNGSFSEKNHEFVIKGKLTDQKVTEILYQHLEENITYKVMITKFHEPPNDHFPSVIEIITGNGENKIYLKARRVKYSK